MRIIARIHGYNCGRRTAIGEHTDKDEVSVVDPIEGVIEFGLEPRFFEEVADAGGHGEIRVKDVGLVFRGVHVCYG